MRKIMLVLGMVVVGLVVFATFIYGSEEQKDVEITKTVNVTITSDPSGAEILVGNSYRGHTPNTIVLHAETTYNYRLRVLEEGEYNLYKEFAGTLNTGLEDSSISVWIERTTSEEQSRQIEAARAASESEERARLVRERQDLVNRVRLSPWTHRESRDSITDMDASFVIAPATRYPSVLERDATLAIICARAGWHGVDIVSSGIVIVVDADTYIGNRDYRVDYRFDENPPVQNRTWRISTTGTHVFIPASHVPTFLTGLRDATVLTLRVYDYRGRIYDYEFQVSGASDALSLLSCYEGN